MLKKKVWNILLQKPFTIYFASFTEVFLGARSQYDVMLKLLYLCEIQLYLQSTPTCDTNFKLRL